MARIGKKAGFMDARAGRYAFLAGVLLAVVVGLFSSMSASTRAAVSLVLVVLGLLVGLLNITSEETVPFLVAAIALMGTSTLVTVAVLPGAVGRVLGDVLANIALFVAPGALVVALKTIKSLAEAR